MPGRVMYDTHGKIVNFRFVRAKLADTPGVIYLSHSIIKSSIIIYLEGSLNQQMLPKCRTIRPSIGPVSYTHLTLPTIYSV